MNVSRLPANALDVCQLPATFSMDNLSELQLDAKYTSPPCRKHLAHHVKRYPLDLRAQVQRVLANKDQDTLAGVLQDLFIALKDKGLKLRGLVFEQVREKLSEADQTYFSNWLTHDFEHSYDGRFLPGSVLATGVAQAPQPLIVQAARVQSSYTSFYQEALDCLEYGQLETAQELLEQELLNPEGDARAEQELLRVYSYTKDYESQSRLMQLLQSQGREPGAEWNLPDPDTK